MLRGGLRSFVVARQLGQPDARRAVQRNILVVEACVGVCCLLCAASRDIRCIVEDVRETIAVMPVSRSNPRVLVIFARMLWLRYQVKCPK
jgi:hypothetical protein